MGTYDRSLQWRMMQQRHPHSSLTANPYFASGLSALGSTAGGERRAGSLQGSFCGPSSSSSSAASSSAGMATATDPLASPSNYYHQGNMDDRQAPLKRQRMTKLAPGSSAISHASAVPSSSAASSASSSSAIPQRANALASYLPSVSDSYSSSATSSSYAAPASDSYSTGGPPPPTSSSSSSSGVPHQEFGNNDSWFSQRSAGGGSSGLTVNTSNSYASGGEANGGAGVPGLSRTSSLASPTTMFGMENLMADYESGFYSLWNGPNGAGVMGYDHEPSTAASSSAAAAGVGRHASVEASHVYVPEEELKMDYPQLPDLNQGDLDYIYGTMDPSGGGCRGSGNEPHIERAYAAAADLHRGAKRDRLGQSDETMLGAGLSSPTHSSLLSPLPPSGFRHLARTTTMETKRPAPPRGSGQAASSSSYHADSLGAGHATTTLATSSAAGRRPAASSSSSGGSGSAGAKRPRSRQCDFPGCENRARSHQKCKKHGGAHQCVYEGCMKNSQSRGLCIAHGGGSRCKVDGCTRASQSKGRCKSHGGGEFCAVEGCRKKAHLKHLCRTHGGGVRCKDPKCMKWAQRKGWCMAHAKEVLGT